MKLSKEALQKMIQEELGALAEQTLDLDVDLYGEVKVALESLYDNALEQSGDNPRAARKAMQAMFTEWLRMYAG